MEKVTQFLEKNVEWIALGLGGLFLLWVLWAYVITPPVQVQIDGRQLTLGEVDRHIRDNAARRLQQAIDDPTRPNYVFERLENRYAEIMSNSDRKAPNLSGTQFAWVMPPLNLDIIGQDREDGLEQIFVEALPKLPAPRFVNKVVDGQPTSEQAVGRGRSLVMIPDVAPPQLVVGGQANQPVQPPFNPNDPNQPVQQVDRLWVSALATIPGKGIADAFQESKVFQVAPNATTIFLRIEVEREELLPGGSWGNATMVPSLAINPLPPLPADAQREMAFAYADWAEQNVITILKPPFYPILKGSTWHKPGEPEPVLPVMDDLRRDTPDPTVDGRRPPRTTRDPSVREPAGRDRPSRGGRGNNAPRDTDRPISAADGTIRFHQVPPNPGDDYPPDYYGGNPGMNPGSRQPGGLVAAQVPPLVTRKFQPSAEMPDVEIWFHDDSVESGKTYRYRVRYRMLNPIFGLFNVSRPDNLTEQFALTSEWSQWSQPIGLDSLVQYFVYGWRPNANTVNFEVFKWENGIWQSEIFQNLQPGDMIGGTRQKNNQAVDFTTGVTVVDIREDARRETFVLLVDSQGNLLTRSFRQDQGSSEYRDLRDKVRQDAAAAQPAASMR